MTIAPYLREIGRGKDGARALNAAQAEDLMTQVLAGRVSDLELGAFCVAMRIKGETPAELAGFLAATRRHCMAPPTARTAVWLPSYNGARKLPNLTAVLAIELARQGVGVLVHGPSKDPGRVTTAQVFESAGLPIVKDAAALHTAWQAGQAAFMDIADLCPPMDKLLAVRWTIGLRTPAHSVAKLLDPFAASPTEGVKSIRVVNHTHPEYAIAMAAFLQHIQANAMLMRGTEGEPVADARRQPKCDIYLRGVRVNDLCLTPQEGVLTSLPALPASHSAADTAAYIAAVHAGSQAIPTAIQAQANALVQALARGA